VLRSVIMFDGSLRRNPSELFAAAVDISCATA
jgi:hypothetical protein